MANGPFPLNVARKLSKLPVALCAAKTSDLTSTGRSCGERLCTNKQRNQTMLILRQFLNSLPSDQQSAFAIRCGTSLGYLRKALSIRQKISAETCILIEEHSQGQVCCEALRPDINWAVIRGHCPEQQAA